MFINFARLFGIKFSILGISLRLKSPLSRQISLNSSAFSKNKVREKSIVPMVNSDDLLCKPVELPCFGAGTWNLAGGGRCVRDVPFIFPMKICPNYKHLENGSLHMLRTLRALQFNNLKTPSTLGMLYPSVCSFPSSLLLIHCNSTFNYIIYYFPQDLCLIQGIEWPCSEDDSAWCNEGFCCC